MYSQQEEYNVSNNNKSSLSRNYSFQSKSPKKKNELANLYDQLRETNFKLKEGTSRGNSTLLGDVINESIEKGQSIGNISRVKEEEIRRMRTEKLEKIRSENQRSTSRTPEKRDLSYAQGDILGHTSSQILHKEASPQFLNEKTFERKTARSGGRDTFYNTGNEENEIGPELKSIDIARDYLLYSAQKYGSEKPTYQAEISWYDDTTEKYSQHKLFRRQKEREHAEKVLQEHVNEEIKKLANTKKMSENSYKIMIRKLEASLSDVLQEVDRSGRKLISFEQLGRTFTLLDVFRAIRYDENCNLENEEQFFAGNSQDQKRRYMEMVVHEEIWKLLAEDEEAEHIEGEFLYVALRIMLDPANLPPSKISKILQDYIDKYRRDDKDVQKTNESQDISVDNLQLIELVKNFKKLTEHRLHYNQTGYLKARKAEELHRKNEAHTFKPKISELSKAIDKYHTQRFVEQVTLPAEKVERSPSPQQMAMKENLDTLLFDLKGGMQTTFQGQGENNPRAGNQGNQSMLSGGRDDLNTSKRQQIDPIDNRVQVIYKKHEVAEKRKDEQRKLKKLEDMKECTFQPMIKNYKYPRHQDPNETVNRLYNHSIIKKKKEEERIMEQIEKETREMEECTFKPDINRQGVLEPKDLPKGFEKNIIRMRYATDEARKKKEALEKISVGENYEKLRKAKVKPFSFVENPRNKRNAPFVYIEINVAPGRTGRIGIHEDDDPRILAKNFAVAFQITQDMERNLEEIITQQLQDHFAKHEYQDME